DMKGSIAAAVHAVRAIKHTLGSVPISVMLGMTFDDETAGPLGCKYVIEQGLKSVAWPEPTLHILGEANALNITGVFKGRIWMKIAVQGKTAHGGSHHQGINAIEQRWHSFVERRIRSMAEPMKPEDPLFSLKELVFLERRSPVGVDPN